MKSTFKPFFILSIFTLVFFTGACKLEDGDIKPSAPGSDTPRSAKFTAGTDDVTVSKPFDGIFDNNGVVYNTVALAGSDGSQISISFKGASPGTFQLHGYSSAYYQSPDGKQYNAVSGTLTVTSYKVEGATSKFSATFSFTAASPDDDTDIVKITNGVITNCSNEL